MTQLMRAVLVVEPGAAPRVGDRRRPERSSALPPGFPINVRHVPQGDQVPRSTSLVAVSYAALNPIDLHIASGTFFQGVPQVPYVPGVEGAGTIVESTTYAAGTRVRFELGHGGYGGDGALSEIVVVDDAGVVPLPDSVDDAAAAALGVAGITAARALDIGEPAQGDTILVLGGTGSIGKTAVQLARRRGAGRVVAAGRNPSQLGRASELGADAVVDVRGKTTPELTAAFRDACAGGADVILDPLWGEIAFAALAAGNFGVRLANFGQAAVSSTEVSSVLVRNLRVTVRGISTAMDTFEVRRAAYRDALQHLAAGALVVDHVIFPMAEIEAAWRAQSTSAGSRILVRIGAPIADSPAVTS